MSLKVSLSFLETIKLISIRHANSVLQMLQERLPNLTDRFYGLFPDLSDANKACSLSLSSISDQEACALLNEMLFTRLKAEQYYQQMSFRLKSNIDKHKLRKPITEVQMKLMQVVGALREKLKAHIVNRLESTCLLSFIAQNWKFHKDSFTSTSWVDRVSVQVNPFESTMSYVTYVAPRPGKKSLILSPSRALTTWRM